jgi:hypothetical protein
MACVTSGKYAGRMGGGEPPKDESEHHIRCPACRGWIDSRHLGQALAHAGDLPHASMPEDHPQ